MTYFMRKYCLGKGGNLLSVIESDSIDFKTTECSVFFIENRQMKNGFVFTHFPPEEAHFLCTRSAITHCITCKK